MSFGLIGFKNAKKNGIFFFAFLSHHYGFTNFVILNFIFANMITVKYCLSTISTSRIIKLKKCKIQFFSLSCLLLFLIFAFKIYASLQKVPIKCPRQLYYIEFICRRTCEKNQVWISYLWLVSRCPKPGSFFGKFTVQQVLKSFDSRNNSLEPLAVGFSNSYLYAVEKSRDLRALISWVLC